MTNEQVFTFMSQLGGEVESTKLGITWGPLRLETGGGIAGHLDQWWITFPGDPSLPHYGPFKTTKQLRRWFVDTIKFAITLSEQLNSEADFERESALDEQR